MENLKLPGTLKESYEKRNEVAGKIKSLQEEAKNAGSLEDSKWQELDRMLDEHSEYTKHIQRLEGIEKMQADQLKTFQEKEEKKEEKKEERTADEAFMNWLRRGTIEQKDAELMGELRSKGSALMGNFRATTDPQSTTDAAGGYLIPTGFQAQLDQAMLAYFQAYDAFTILPTSMGNDLHWPTVNDTSIKGHLLTENSQDTVSVATFSEVIFYAYMFTSYIVKTSLQLVQDSALPLESILANLLGERLGRILGDYFTTGTGSSQPEGVAYKATDASISGTSASAITRANILDLIYSVDPMYRNAPGSALMMHDSTLKAIAKLTIGASDDRPLWQPSIVTGQPDTIEGKRFYINQSMDEIGASKEIMLFGDLKKFVIRRVLGTTLFVYREKYMDYLQIGFQAYNRWDSRLLDAGTHPIKKLVLAAT
jgi:HK97 family phage major capsid protein